MCILWVPALKRGVCYDSYDFTAINGANFLVN